MKPSVYLEAKISSLLKPHNPDEIPGAIKNADGSYDVDGDVHLERYRVGRTLLIKLPVVFRNVSGHFYCDHNQLESLEGAPRRVGKNFCCQVNYLTSIAGGPEYVGGDYVCYLNKKEISETEVRSLCEVKGKVITKLERI